MLNRPRWLSTRGRRVGFASSPALSTFVAENEIFSDGFVRRRSVYRIAIQIPEWALTVSIYIGGVMRHR